MRSRLAVLLLFVAVVGCTRVYRRPEKATKAPETTVKPVIVVAAGDISCDPASRYFNVGKGARGLCQMQATAELAAAQNPDAVLTLGDEQYENGRLEAFRQSYENSWGKLKDKTRPVPGNHEYHQPDARGYFSYFGAQAGEAGKGYYSFDLGAWHIVALNSNCSHVPCAAGSDQERWLKRDLDAHKDQCILAFWHAPRFSSGLHGGSGETAAFWRDLYDAHADIVLNGHDHDYERFAPQSPAARADAKGVREFVVGTGGKNLRGFVRRVMWHNNRNSEVRQAVTFGVLRLALYPGAYTWQYLSENETAFSDTGYAPCHNAK